jgi:hypothetical protein
MLRMERDQIRRLMRLGEVSACPAGTDVRRTLPFELEGLCGNSGHRADVNGP